MGALIIILRVILLLSCFGFIASSDRLQCYNDYCTELTCSLTLDQGSCTEFSLNASLMIAKIRHYTCRFNETRPGMCECTMHVQGFVLTEIFTMNVFKGKNLWLTKNIRTEESIKPRRPSISSLVQKENGDLHITLNTTYVSQKIFSDYLMVELTYSIYGSHENVTKRLEKRQTTCEILGRNLQPDSRYILKARVKSDYHPDSVFSDYSEPYEFKTPPSLLKNLKIIIPILCLLLIICLSSIYFWFDRILKPWWDKIPTPKISTDFVKQVRWLLPFQTEFSAVSVDSTANPVCKKTSMESSQGQCTDHQYRVCSGNGGDSAPDDYSTTCHDPVKRTESVPFQCDKEHQSTNLFNSGVSNRSYSQSSSSGSSFFKHQEPNDNQSENFLLLGKNQIPKIPTDLNYCMWNGCTDSGTSKLIQVVLAYNSMDNHNALSSCKDQISGKKENDIKKPRDVPCSVHDSIAMMPMEDEYQVI